MPRKLLEKAQWVVPKVPLLVRQSTSATAEYLDTAYPHLTHQRHWFSLGDAVETFVRVLRNVINCEGEAGSAHSSTSLPPCIFVLVFFNPGKLISKPLVLTDGQVLWRVVHTGSVRCSVAMFRRGTQTSRHGVLCATEHFAPHRFCDGTSRWNTSFSAWFLFHFHVALYRFQDAVSCFVHFLKYKKFIHFTCSFLAWRCFLTKLIVFFVVWTGTGCHLSVCGRAKKQDLFLF